MSLKESILAKIKDEVFFITFCIKCKKYIWPPSYNCKYCFRKTTLKELYNKGVLLEVSYSHLPNQNNYFGIGEFSGIRILGMVAGDIKINDGIEISKIKVNDGRISVEFNKLKTKK
jgi:uncharacterized OB-fold protein